MSSQYHPFFVVTDDLDHPTVKTIFASARLNNLAVEAQQNGLFEDAVDLHRQALAMKLTVRDPESVEVAISYEGLGVALRLSGKVLEAREYHEKALYIREDGEFGGLGKGIREDAACTRDSLACILEFEGRMKEAREMRLRGEAKDEMLCANFHEASPVHACSAVTSSDTMQLCSALKPAVYPEASSEPASAVTQPSIIPSIVRRSIGYKDTNHTARLIRQR
jgi:hypothetical protein